MSPWGADPERQSRSKENPHTSLHSTKSPPTPRIESTYRGTSLTRKRTPLGPYRRPMPRVIWGSQEGGCFLMGEVPLYMPTSAPARYLREVPSFPVHETAQSGTSSNPCAQGEFDLYGEHGICGVWVRVRQRERGEKERREREGKKAPFALFPPRPPRHLALLWVCDQIGLSQDLSYMST